MQLNTYKTILGMIPPKVAQIGTPMVVVCKDDELVRTRKIISGRHLIDFEAELKKSNMITQQQMAECLGVPRWFVELKVRELVKKGIAKRKFIGHHIGRQAFFFHVDNENI
jgi:hypothetical protein